MRKSRTKNIKEWAYRKVMRKYGIKDRKDLSPPMVVEVAHIYKEGKKQWTNAETSRLKK